MNNTATTAPATYELSFAYKGERHTFETCGCAANINDSVHSAIESNWEDSTTWEAAERIIERLLVKGAPCTMHDC